MASSIRRIVQLVFDKASGQKTEAEARRALGGVDGALSGLKRAAVQAGAALAAAFGIRAIVAFGRAAIREAQESEAAWADLAGTIDAAGGSFQALGGDLQALAGAFQDATKYADEDYARTLMRLVSITGDVDASIANVGLVADVAARFFRGDLAPAADLVAKAMNGNVMQLQRMGIHAGSASEALEILSERSMGAAAEQARTFGGRVAQLTNLWGEFKEELGFVLIGSDKVTGALDVLVGMVKAMARWVSDNREGLREWVSKGLQWTILTVDALYRSLRGLGELMVGSFMVSLGAFTEGWARAARAMTHVVDVALIMPRFFGAFLGKGDPIAARTARIREQSDALIEWARVIRGEGVGSIGAGLRRFATPGQWTELPTQPTGAPTERGRPRVGTGGTGPTDQEVAAAQAAAERILAEDQRRYEVAQQMREADVDMEWEAYQSRVAAAQWARDVMLEEEQRYAEKVRALEEEEKARRITAAGLVGEAVGAAMAGGLARYFKLKGQENLVHAAEAGYRFLVGDVKAGAAVAGFLLTAAKWFALSTAASAIGGGGGGGGAPGGGAASAARGASAGAAASAQSKNEVHIYLTGPGWDALNPAVQRVVWGATQAARERYGDAVVRLHRSGR